MSVLPSEINYSGLGGALKFDRTLIDGFWHSDKRIWMMLRKSIDSQAKIVLKTVSTDGGDNFFGKMSMDGKTYNVKCRQRG